VAPIEHVIVLALENRSFDHMLGFLDHPDPTFDGLLGGHPFTNPGWDGRPEVTAVPGAKPVLPFDPDHSHDAVMEQLAMAGGGPGNLGFVSSYERKGRGLAPPGFGGLLGPLVDWWVNRRAPRPAITDRGPLAMLCQPPAQVPVLSELALRFAVCTRWFCSVPGETWPNRNYMHAATSDGEVDIYPRFYTNPTTFELLERHGASWHIYHDDTPQVWAFSNLWVTAERHANWFHLDEFAGHVADGRLPAYAFLEPNHRPPLHTLDHAPIIGAPDVSNSQHPGNNRVANDAYDGYQPGPDTDFARGEALIATVYEALRARPDVFARSLLLITYDEHGGLCDHVPPPTGLAAIGDTPGLLARLLRLLWYRTSRAFDFTTLGPRVPAVVVSPLIRAGTVDTEIHEHASIPATLRALFAAQAPPLTSRDRDAVPFHTLATLSPPRTDLPDLSAHVRPVTRVTARMTPIPADVEVPPHYLDFVRQADLVRERLRQEGEPEALRAAPAQPAQRAVETTDLFLDAARRHRQAL
jgi:phospholipase C